MSIEQLERAQRRQARVFWILVVVGIVFHGSALVYLFPFG